MLRFIYTGRRLSESEIDFASNLCVYITVIITPVQTHNTEIYALIPNDTAFALALM